MTFFFDIFSDIFLTYFLTYLLTFFLAYCLTTLSDILSGISSDILSDVSSGILSDISSDILSGILSDMLSDIFSNKSFRILFLTVVLRPSAAHSARKLPVEVRRCPLRSGAPRWGRRCPLRLGFPRWGPALPTAMKSWRKGWQLRPGNVHGNEKRRRRRRRRSRDEEEEETALIKSNNPHLTGGTKQQWSGEIYDWIWLVIFFLTCTALFKKYSDPVSKLPSIQKSSASAPPRRHEKLHILPFLWGTCTGLIVILPIDWSSRLSMYIYLRNYIVFTSLLLP